MKRLILILAGSVLLTGTMGTVRAENLFSMKIGMLWPQALLSTGMPSGDAELEYGAIIDKKVGFGIAGNFLWNVQAKDAKDASGHYKTISDAQTYMFPIMGFFIVDPVPEVIVHPVFRFQIGYNSMIYSANVDTGIAGANAPLEAVSPYFYGLIMKAGVDALYNLGKNSALFLGVEYQWADTKTADTKGGLFDKRDMSGIGIRGGFRVIM